MDVIESIERFLRRVDIYTQIPHTQALDEMVIKIVLELLSTLAIATKGFKQGQSSGFVPIDMLPYLLERSEAYKETFWRERRRGGIGEVGQTHTR